MAQWVKALATNTEDLRLIPETYLVKESADPWVLLGLDLYIAYAGTSMLKYTHKCNQI